MKIRRQRSPDRFTVVDNVLIEDRSIPYRALGVISFLLSRPDGWETDSNDLAHRLGDATDQREGRDAVRTALRQLERAGYLHRERVQNRVTGTWSWMSTVSDRPALAPTPRNPSSAPTPRNPTPGKPTDGFLGVKNPSTDPKHGTKSPVVPEGDQPPPVVTFERSRDARREEEASIDDTLATLGDVDELFAEVRCIRREHNLPANRWSDHNQRRAIVEALHRGYPPTAIPDALRELARDPATQSPGRLPHDGAWWTAAEADALRRRRLDNAARARTAAAEAERQRIAECARCHGTGTFESFAGRKTRCDHIPDVDETTA